MKLKDVKVGERYHAKVSGSLRVVRVVRFHTRYDSFTRREKTTIECVNEMTNRTITVRSPQRLRPLPMTTTYLGKIPHDV
jgi:hypothetical protein